jgi:hypothetical protein
VAFGGPLQTLANKKMRGTLFSAGKALYRFLCCPAGGENNICPMTLSLSGTLGALLSITKI